MRKRLFTLLLCLALPLSACGQKSVETPEPTPTAEETATPSPSPAATPEPEPTPEDITELWGFPIDDTHDAFEVPTGGKLGTVLVTVEMNGEEFLSTVSVWDTSDLEAPIQTIEAEGVTTHRHELVDANFDGCMDFVYTWFSGAKNNDSGLYVWDEEQGHFVLKKDFIGDLVIDGEKNSIYIYANGAGPSGTAKIFRWESEELILKRIIDFLYPETLEDGTIQQEIAVKDIVDGELREVYRETYHTSDEIAAAMDAYYDGALLWYDLDYHGEDGNTLWGFPIDDAHDAFEVPTGGRLGTVLVTGTRGFDDGLHLEIYAVDDLLNPIQSIVVEDGMFGWTETVDINFDNYMDFGIMYSMGASNTYWHYWRWNEADGQFEEEPALSELCEPFFDVETQIISSYANYSVASGVQTYWQWREGELTLIRRIETHYPEWEKEDVTQLLTVEDTVNGELTEVYRETFGDPNDGKIYEEAEKWYDLDHHGS